MEIYTDGGCIGNPGPGGFAVVFMRHGEIVKEFSQSYKHTTNNRMEYRACLYALEQIKAQNLQAVTLYTDSKYVMQSVTEWGHKWKQLGWARNKSGSEKIKNEDLFKACYLLNEVLKVDWQWVKGHAGNLGNERADILANTAASAPAANQIEDLPVIPTENATDSHLGQSSLF
jgi:ribonuclease HI